MLGYGKSMLSHAAAVLVLATVLATLAHAAPKADPLVVKGTALIKQEKFAEAVTELNAVLTTNPRHVEATRLRGIAHRKLLQFEAAIRDFNKVIELDPKNYPGYAGRAMTKREANNIPGAIEDLNVAIGLAPPKDAGSLLITLSYYHLDSGNYPAVLDACVRSKQAAVNAESVNCVGWAYLRLGQYDKARQEFDQLIQLNGTLFSAYSGRAKAYLELGQLEKARKDYDKVAELSPDIMELGDVQEDLAKLSALEKGEKPSVAAKPAPAEAPKPKPAAAPGTTEQARKGVPAAGPGAQALSTPMGLRIGERRVVAPFTGYALSEQCEKKAFVQPGVPWKIDGSDEPADVLVTGTDAQYYAALRNTMRNLRVFYGGVSAEEERTFNAYWAPFFDHPTKAAFDYFQQINVLLDEYLVTRTTLEGMLPAFSEGFQDYLLSTVFLRTSDTAMHGALTTSQYEAIKDQRKRMDELLRQIGVLGNPPNPLAIRCAARKQHAKSIETAKPVGMAPAAKPAAVKPGERPAQRSANASGSGESSNASGMAWVLKKMEKLEWVDVFPEDRVWSSRAEEGQLEFKFSHSKPSNAHLKGNVTLTWTPPPRIVRPGDVAIQASVRKSGDANAQLWYAAAVRRSNDHTASAEQVEPWRQSNDPNRIGYPLNGMNLCCEYVSQEYPRGVGKVAFYDGSPGATYLLAIQACGLDMNLYPCELLATFAYTYQWEPAVPEQAPQPEVAEEDEARLAREEAISHHEAITRQIEENAAKFEAEAAREKNPSRRDELMRIAADMRENAQAERDLAESLRRGVIVHTRTAGDDRRHNQMVADIRQELAGFDREKELLSLIPKGAALIEDGYGVKVRKDTEQRVSEALHATNREEALSKIYGDIKKRVATQAEVNRVQVEQKAEAWTEYIEEAEAVKQGATMALMIGTLGAPLGASTALGAASAAAAGGELVLGYSTVVGYTEDGIVGAGKAAARGVSTVADITISMYEGATRIDPATGQPRGVWGAMEEGAGSAALNLGFGLLSAGVQQLTKMKFSGSSGVPKGAAGPIPSHAQPQERTSARTALEAQGAGSRGIKGAVKAQGESRIREYDFKSSEQRYREELALTKTPQEKAIVEKKYDVVSRREQMHGEKEQAIKRADESIPKEARNPDGTVKSEHPSVKEAHEKLSNELNRIEDKYKESGPTDRNRVHDEAIKESGLAMEVRNEKGEIIIEGDMAQSGSKPKGAGNDIDLTMKGSTPDEAYRKGRRYIETMKKNGHNVVEFGDRWVITGMDATVWKPGFGQDLPGSSSLEAGVIFGTLPGSDKFGTHSGIEWTSTGKTRDPFGAYLANMGKATGAGLGNSRPKDLHVIGKSVSKVAELGGVELDGEFKSQLDALRAHKTPEQAGIVQLGASPAAKQRQIDAFLAKAEKVAQQAGESTRTQSAQNVKTINDEASSAMKRARTAKSQNEAQQALNEAFNLKQLGKSYEAGDQAALQVLQKQSPRLMGRVERPSSSGLRVNLAPLANKLIHDREKVAEAKAMTLNGKDPAFGDLGARCKQGADLVGEKLKAVKPGSDEAKHLSALKVTLERGAINPAIAVQETRLLTGYELATVLKQINRGTVKF